MAAELSVLDRRKWEQAAAPSRRLPVSQKPITILLRLAHGLRRVLAFRILACERQICEDETGMMQRGKRRQTPLARKGILATTPAAPRHVALEFVDGVARRGEQVAD